MATLKDVAKLANVDVSTVSRALNAHQYVHPETRKRIEEAVKVLSYQPNLLARGLRQGKRNNIAVLIPNLSVSVFSEITQAIEIEARKHHYGVLVCDTESDEEIERGYLERMQNSFVDGIIISPTLSNKALLRKIDKSGLPVLQLIRDEDAALSGVATDYFCAGLEGTKFLIAQGCKDVAMISGPREYTPYKERYNGYLKALEENGMKRKNKLIHTCLKNSFQEGYQGMRQLLQSGVHLDGVAVAAELQALGALRAMREYGVNCPQEIKLISMAGHSIARMLERGMTCMEMPSAQIGAKAFSMMLQAVENPQTRTPEHVKFTPALVVRETT